MVPGETGVGVGPVGRSSSPVPAGDGSYRLPVDAGLLAQHPSWLEGMAPTAALAVDAGTQVVAPTAGTVSSVLPGQLVLSGDDGGTYRLAGLGTVAASPGAKVVAGQALGSAGPGGITFGIDVPDVAAPVCVMPALQAWAVGNQIDVHALPVTCPALTLPGTTAFSPAVMAGLHQPPAVPVTAPAPTTDSAPGPPVTVLVVTDHATAAIRSNLQSLLTGAGFPGQIASADVLSGPDHDLATQVSTAAAASHPDLVIVAIDNPAVEQASTVATVLAQTPVLWVRAVKPSLSAAAGAADGQQYEGLVKRTANLRVLTLPGSLIASGLQAADGSWTAAGDAVVASGITNYVGIAYGVVGPGHAGASLLSYAESQLGKPYLWAGSGPESFDCSGLTMMAYRQVGVGFTHNAYEQFEATKQWAVLSPNGLQPGDLVFFGPTEAGIHHVGLYVGGGQFLDAPHTGATVRFDTLGPGWDYYGATRPLTSMVTVDTSGSIRAAARQSVDRLWGDTQWPFLDALWTQESSWNPAAVNSTSGATGIPQALPAAKMAAAGPDWRTNPATQVSWGLSYITTRYGNPQAAWAHEQAFNWY